MITKVFSRNFLTVSSQVVKAITDRSCAILLLALLSPALLIIAIAIYLQMGYPIFFTQHRPGKNEHIFNLYKFRTMNSDCDNNGKLLPDAKRLTALGRFLRQTSLDELPQLWNVLKGEMSFVGPRPLLVKYLSRYTPEQAQRHEVLPGITGWSQVNGRNCLDWEQKFMLDVWYVNNWSLWLDFKILLLTVYKVFKREGVNQSQDFASPEFMGTESQK
jgi:lipopolysaccharide/colanic/teichoic acid biosynthesis glycosyltransferase